MRDVDTGFRRLGPLGAANMRRQQGRSFRLHTTTTPGIGLQPGQAPTTRERLIYTGGLGKGNEGTGDAYASACTLACSITGRGTVRGKIEWGTDGHSNVVFFDWLQGTVIHVAGSAFTLEAELVPTAAEELLADDLDVTVGASIGYYAAGRRSPTRTLYGAALAAGAVDIEITPFAAVLHVASDVSPLDVLAEFRDAAGVVLTVYTEADFIAGASVPVPNGAAVVRLSPPVGARVFAAVFGLSL